MLSFINNERVKTTGQATVALVVMHYTIKGLDAAGSAITKRVKDRRARKAAEKAEAEKNASADSKAEEPTKDESAKAEEPKKDDETAEKS